MPDKPIDKKSVNAKKPPAKPGKTEETPKPTITLVQDDKGEWQFDKKAPFMPIVVLTKTGRGWGFTSANVEGNPERTLAQIGCELAKKLLA